VRLLTALLLLALIAGTSYLHAPATVVSAAPAYDDNDNDDDEEFEEDGDSVDELVDEVADAANELWDAVFKERGKRFIAPRLVKASADEKIRSKCGNSRRASYSYCPADRAVYLDWDSDDETSIVNLWGDDRSFVIVTTMGHEWGHHVQNQLGVFDVPDAASKSVQFENQADCLMGIFANNYAKTSDWVTRADFRDAIADTVESGDDPDTPMSERTHGTPDQRVEAFLRGYWAKSLSACGL
jgi:predicted metalloprotease